MAVETGALFSVKGGVRSFMMDISQAQQGIVHVLVCPTFTSLKLDPADSQREVEETNCNADKVVALKYTEKSSLNLSWEIGNSTTEMKAAAMGQRIMLKPTDSTVPYGLAWVNAPDTATPTLPASATGVYGSGVLADASAVGAAMIDGATQQLTQVPFGTFSFAALRSFAIGADGEMKFSADLRGKVISVGGALHTVANVYDTQGADIITQLRIQHHYIDHNRGLSIFDADVSLERSGFDLGQPNQSFKGLVNGGKYRIRVIPRINRC